MKCADRLRASNSPLHQLSQKVQQKIWNFFEPLSIKSKEKGVELIQQLCDESVTLSLLMRKSKDILGVEDLYGKRENLQNLEAYAEECEEEPGTPENRGTIAYCLFGGLFKRPAEDPRKLITLEKAQVVVYA
jgi:hypothetical protein